MRLPFPDRLLRRIAAKLPRRYHSLPVLLSPDTIYIVPSRAGWGLLLVLLAMLTGAINYSLNLGFILVFLLAGMGLASMLQSWRNLAWLHIGSLPPTPVFAGEDATLALQLTDTRQRARYALAVTAHGKPADPGSAITYIDITTGQTANAQLALPTSQRGWQDIPPLSISSGFPAGLFRVWSRLSVPGRYLVYPRPVTHSLPLPQHASPGASDSGSSQPGDEDFAGLRHYQPGDSPRRIDWKASSREQGLYLREFHAPATSRCWLDLAQTPGSSLEQRLSQLASWVIEAHALRLHYGLRLPGTTLEPAQGEAHYHDCLRALALLDQS